MIQGKKVILGLKAVSHDTGAALMVGDKVVAIAEERLNRVKHSHNMFPKLAIDYCLGALGATDKDVDLIVVDQVGSRKERSSADIFRTNMGERFLTTRLEVINHHDAHAAAAFFCSPFQESAVLIVDGSGEKFETPLGVVGTETETLYKGVGNRLTEIHKTLHIRERAGFPYTFGIGKLYTLFTEGIVNLGHYNEGKLMGLGPYGTPDLLKQYPLEHFIKEVGNDVVCNARITFPGVEDFYSKKKVYSGLESFLRRVSRSIGKFFFGMGGSAAFSEPAFFPEVHLLVPRRAKDVQLPDKQYNDAAYLVQKVFEEGMVMWGKKLKTITGSENLCVAGGAGLNIDANKRFLDDVGFKHLFVQPGASDTGIALGCVLFGAHQIFGLPRIWEMKSASLGKVYTEKDIVDAIEARKDEINVSRSKDIATDAAKLVAKGNIIGWYQGGAEYGPRALGNRSILCDARDPGMKDKANNKVKHRESWRPFAASVLAEKMSEWFDITHESPFMLLASQVHKDKQSKVPSIVHVDGTCRIQSVTPESNALYYDLLKAFERESGVPMVLNTSYNLAGEPIVETPADAIRCFLSTNMDALIVHDRIITKK
jgi:carbamoyltransferase